MVNLINDFKQYFLEHKQPIYENPAPGNKQGGITTLEEKSLGAVQKGGRATITDVLAYGEPTHIQGLNLLQSPGNDAVSSTALIASGATILLFTTGRGTPLGFPALRAMESCKRRRVVRDSARFFNQPAGMLKNLYVRVESLENAVRSYPEVTELRVTRTVAAN